MRDPELQCKHVLLLQLWFVPLFFVMHTDRDAAEGVIHWQTKGILHEEFPFFLSALPGKHNNLNALLICKIMAVKNGTEVSSQKLKEQ